MLEFLTYAILLVFLLEVLCFAIKHAVMRQWAISELAARPFGIVCAALIGFALLFLVATPVAAQGLTGVAECLIKVNREHVVSPELRKAERQCYDILPKHVAAQAYAQRGMSTMEDRIVEVRQNSLQAPAGVPRHTPIDPVRNAAPALRYPYPYGPGPRYAAPDVQYVAPR